jgi:hypothetical protein
LHYLKKNGRPNEWWKNENFQTIMQNENNKNNENIKYKEKKKIKEKKIKFFKVSEDNDNDEDDNEDSNIYGLNKILNKQITIIEVVILFLSSLLSSYDKFVLNHMDFRLSENENLENYIHYNDLIKDNDNNFIDGLKLIHQIYYNKYNAYKLFDKLRYFVLFDEKGDIINIIDSLKNVISIVTQKIKN